MGKRVRNWHPFLQLLLAMGLLIYCYIFLFPFIGIALAAPLFHLSFSDLLHINDLDKVEGNPNMISALKFLQAFTELGFLVAALFFGFFMGKKRDYLKFNRSTYLIPAAVVIGIVILSQPFIAYLGEFNSHLQLPAALSSVQKAMKSMEDEADAITTVFLQMPDIKELIINLLVIAFITAICEEAFFRGTLQQVLVSWFKNKHVAVWITAAIFSALHLEFFGFLPRMILGVILGYIFLWSGNLWYSIAGHMINNGLAVIAYYFYQAKIITYDPVSNDTGPVWLTLASMVLFIGLLFFYHNYFKHHPPVEEETISNNGDDLI